MGANFRLWWQFIKRHSVVSVLIAYIALGYSSDWTGFAGYIVETTARTINNPSGGSITISSQYFPAKTLWDWLGLSAIIGSVFITGYASTWSVTTQIRANRQQPVEDRQLTTLHTYMDQISQLLLDKNLDVSKPDNNFQKVARVKTLAALPELDAALKGRLLRFLYELGLITVNKAMVDLSSVDLSGANLHGLDLSNADLHQTILSDANLSGADLSGTNLKGATMPDGSIHP